MKRKLRKRQLSTVLRPRMKRRMRTAVALFGLTLGAVSAVHAQSVARVAMATTETSATIDARWRESLDGFAAIDREHAPEPGGIVFVGSSSIRLWNDLEREFGTTGIVKRGFGGSRMSDVDRYAARLVLPYKPRLVVVYAGDNDIAEGAPPEMVLASYVDFVRQVHETLPQTRIAYLSIKPSPSREALMPSSIQANALIQTYSKTDARLDYIDIYPLMLDAKGKPRDDLFLGDKLHLNAAGYAIWKSAIASHLN